jgi:hypothetical protein
VGLPPPSEIQPTDSSSVAALIVCVHGTAVCAEAVCIAAPGDAPPEKSGWELQESATELGAAVPLAAALAAGRCEDARTVLM